MKSILTMAWAAEDPSAFDLAAKLARAWDARLVGLEPPSYGVMSMAWADAGMGAPIGGGLAEDAEERQRVAAVKQAFDARATGLRSEWRSADDSGPTAIGRIVVWNRTDGSTGTRLTDFKVLALDAERKSSFETTVNDPPAPSKAFTFAEGVEVDRQVGEFRHEARLSISHRRDQWNRASTSPA